MMKKIMKSITELPRPVALSLAVQCVVSLVGPLLILKALESGNPLVQIVMMVAFVALAFTALELYRRLWFARYRAKAFEQAFKELTTGTLERSFREFLAERHGPATPPADDTPNPNKWKQ